LDALDRQSPRSAQTVVVDASDDLLTRDLVAKRGSITYLAFPRGRNRMPESRNLGLTMVTEPIVAFIDDDSVVRDGWLASLAESFQDAGVGAVGGPVFCTGDPVLDADMLPPIGVVDELGTIIANFNFAAADPLRVMHLRGCNMSFRTEIINALGGFDRNYAGPNFMEDTDMCMRVYEAGHGLVCNPGAVVDHLNAPKNPGCYTRDGRDVATQYWLCRNGAYFRLRHCRSSLALVRFLLKDSWWCLRDNLLFGREKRPRGVLANWLGKLVGILVHIRGGDSANRH